MKMVMSQLKLILAILIGSALAQEESRDDSAIPKDNGVGCRLDTFLKFKRVTNKRLIRVRQPSRYNATNLPGCKPIADKIIVGIKSPDECRDKCKETDGCRFWTHIAVWGECDLRKGRVAKVQAEGPEGPYTSGSTLSCGV